MSPENLNYKDLKKKSSEQKPVPSWGIFNYISIFIFLLLIYFFFKSSNTATETTWAEFEKLMNQQRVKKVVIKNKEIVDVYLKDTTKTKLKAVESPAYYFT